jgi:hypothetical protein
LQYLDKPFSQLPCLFSSANPWSHSQPAHPCNFDPDSNATEESDLQSQQHPSPKISTDEGRMISIKPVLKNAVFSIRDNLDPDSNVTEESDLQS